MSFPGSILLDQGDVYKTSSTKKHPLGTRGYTQDGRAYRYAQAGASNLTPGMLIQAAAYDSNFAAQEMADSTDWAVPTTGSTIFYLSTDTSLTTASYFVDGYYMVCSGSTAMSEVGQILQIDSVAFSCASGPSGCPKVYAYGEDKLVTALTTANTITLLPNTYKSVIVAPNADAAITGIAVGVCPINVTAAYYFWLQTWGMTCVRVHGTLDCGYSVYYDSNTGCSNTGNIRTQASLGDDRGSPQVGMAQYTGVDGGAGAIFLTLAP